ncbi:alpha-amylase [Nocardioides sp. HDW12B]|uniref:alpha-amylase family glycosyl hydrolase n=1 Tax=Nocardioides sp. HDW12B TaxID=2714939 RepID=UPI001409BDF2|nr:alpha-amylase family glycosyl hydrolase [Nocardioides sp. HDW12B]QIK65970.1 alpha-amylase [Nocardioides sp. HDW12B]
MTPPRRTAFLVATATSTALVLSAQPAQSAPAGRPAAEKAAASSRATLAERIAKPSLRDALTDQNFYFVMADRFNNGDETNDTGGYGDLNDDGTTDRRDHGFDPASKRFYHGGDIQGLQDKLDYLEGLGTEAIWFTPIFKNKPVQSEDGPTGTDGSAGYHGYWITDFTQIDPHLGTNAELAALVEAAHARGMKVFFDIITNHTADVISYESNAREGYLSKDVEPYRDASGNPFDDREYAGDEDFPPLDAEESFPYLPTLDEGEEDLKVPGWLNDVRYYHNRGNTDFQREDEDQQYGDFAGLDDLFTEHPRVVDGMEEIYQTWVSEIGIDGYRIDTMKHVNDEFWQEFGPGVLKYARQNGKPDFYMFGEVYDDRTTEAGKAFLSKFVTRDKMQAILDFGFQASARNFVSKQQGAGALVEFFRDDDYYTDADSNAYQLPTFLGNHDMGRIGYFLKQDNPDASEDELLDRDLLAHELMYLVRGNPVVYYGDEQGFTGSGGDQLARQDMFENTVEDWEENAGPFDDDNLGSEETPDDDNFDADHPLYTGLADLSALTEEHPALRNGVMQPRSGQGAFAFSRIDREKRREYVVVVNASDEDRTTDVTTFVPSSGFTRVYGDGPASLTSARDGSVSVPSGGVSATVYRSDRRIPLSSRAPGIQLRSPSPSTADRSRTEVGADVAGDDYAEVTFQARPEGERWRSIGTDDNRPFRVFHDTAAYDPRTPVRYRAVVADNNGHARMSDVRRSEVPSPSIQIVNPTAGEITGFDPLLVEAQVNPERTSQRVRFERSVTGGDWETIGVDRSSPWYRVTDDEVPDLGLADGDRVRYRAVLLEPGFPSVTSDTVTMRVAEPEPAYDSVTVAGSFQEELGCDSDWMAECDITDLEFQPDGTWTGVLSIPAGDYFWKVPVNDNWNTSFGPNGGGGDYRLVVPTDGDYEFVFNQTTKNATATRVEP